MFYGTYPMHCICMLVSKLPMIIMSSNDPEILMPFYIVEKTFLQQYSEHGVFLL